MSFPYGYSKAFPSQLPQHKTKQNKLISSLSSFNQTIPSNSHSSNQNSDLSMSLFYRFNIFPLPIKWNLSFSFYNLRHFNLHWIQWYQIRFFFKNVKILKEQCPHWSWNKLAFLSTIPLLMLVHYLEYLSLHFNSHKVLQNSFLEQCFILLSKSFPQWFSSVLLFLCVQGAVHLTLCKLVYSLFVCGNYLMYVKSRRYLITLLFSLFPNGGNLVFREAEILFF